MFDSNQNHHHIEFIQNLLPKFRRPIAISSAKVKTLEDSELISLDVKIEILELFAGYRMMSEIIINPSDTDNILGLIKILKIPSFKKTYIVKDKKKYVIHLFRNIATKKYFQNFSKEIGAVELGLLYGYHINSTLAFIGLLTPSNINYDNKSYQRFNRKVMSEEFFESEDKYNKEKWESLRKISPKIIEAVEKLV